MHIIEELCKHSINHVTFFQCGGCDWMCSLALYKLGGGDNFFPIKITSKVNYDH